ncbi:hypothetical protein H6G76_32475 [Nostoc sp. FACHB-152]|nr:hypothetical protein [Nostoc sp. FACHB-152]MBD2451755.1 hypothetical protein [Nostoc sp. FACHB-152]MBD2472866.1 hypothetical protein [Nostoc sp. FACHB-145]
MSQNNKGEFVVLQMNTSGSWQEWVTVLSYVGFTVFIIGCVFAAQKK